jgi:hypothetical protein
MWALLQVKEFSTLPANSALSGRLRKLYRFEWQGWDLRNDGRDLHPPRDSMLVLQRGKSSKSEQKRLVPSVNQRLRSPIKMFIFDHGELS